MSEFDKKARAVADAIGEFLKVAGVQAKALSDVDLMLLVYADSCRGVFKAEIWSRIVEEQKVVEGEVDIETEFKGVPEEKGEVKSPEPKVENDLEKKARITPYFV